MDGKHLTIALACEYQIVSFGIAKYLQEHVPSIITHTVSNLEDLFSTLENSRIDVTFVELSLLKHSGLSVLKSVFKINSKIKVIVLSRDEKEPFISKCIELGALGFLSLKCQPQELVSAVKAVTKSTKYLSQDIAYDLALSSLDKNDQLFSILTTREYQVFTQVAQGKSVVEIAKTMHLSPKTIHVYRASIMKKLTIKNASELTLIALKHGIISVDIIN